jgi:trk system potassium uptake protein TrkH
MLELETWRKMRGLLICIICITLFSEMVGMMLVYSQIASFHSLKHGIFHALFHSISSFCNAGIVIPGKHVAQLGQNYIILLSTTLLMFIGGLGFITWHEVILSLRARWNQTRFRYSLHSRIIIYGSCALLICSSVLFWLLERDHVLSKLPIGLTGITTLFQAVSFKSAGFLIASPESFQSATIFLILVISFIGSSPASTGSGIKVTSLALFLATVRAALSNRGSVDIKGRTIPKDQVFKVVAIIAVALGWIGLSTFCLLVTEKNWQFFDIVVEAWSAFTNLGITMGLTPSLTFVGKCIIILSMIFGRVGIFAIAIALRMVRKQEATTFRYPEERVMIG